MTSSKLMKRIVLAGCGVVAAGVVVLGGSAIADAATPTPSASSSTPADSGKGGGSNDAAVTGSELAKVTAAMTAKDSSVTVTSVRKDPDGSYDVLGTKAGANVMYDVSADLSTFTQSTHAGR
jgi:hypothetical protein